MIANGEGTQYENDQIPFNVNNNARASTSYRIRKPNDRERDIQRLIVLFQMTYVGAPMIYYGDEAGMWGANDPCCRKPMVWPDLRYEAEAAGPDGRPRAEPQPIAFDADLHAHYRRSIALRAALPVLRSGTVETLLADDARQVLVHLRRDAEALAVVAINRSEAPQTIELASSGRPRWRDRLNGDAVVEAHGGSLTVTLAPLWAAVLAP